MTPFLAFTLGVLIVWLMNSQARHEARQWRVAQSLQDGRWWYVFDLSEASQVGPGSIYATLFGLERTGQVESQWGPDGRRRYRMKAGLTMPAEVNREPT